MSLSPFSRRTLAIISGAILLPGALRASVMVHDPLSPLPQGYLERASGMLERGKYNGVIDQLRHLRTQNTDLSLLDLLDPEDSEAYVYMLAAALYERGDEECIPLLREFVRTYPASPHALQASLSIGDYYFFAHAWEKAAEEYDAIDLNRLNASDRLLYSYRRSLCDLKLGETGRARQQFETLRKIAQYREAATFYLAYIDYMNGDLEKAYKGFSEVKSGEEGLESPFYLAQIEYARGQYDKAASRAVSLVKGHCPAELESQTLRIAGMALFKEGDYPGALPYLEKYLKQAGENPIPESLYAAGVIDYEEGRYNKAAARFAPLADLDSGLGQSALLYMGQCDLKSGNADAAAMAFEKAARMNYDRNVAERALYDYAAAVTRGGKIPFSSSADLLERFISTYPDSKHTPVVKEYLAVAYYNDHAYARALQHINSIKKPSAHVEEIKQKILYELGVESVTNGRNTEGATYLRQAIALGKYDKSLAAQARLWLGDALYAGENYREAHTEYAAASASVAAGANRTLALYNQAYASYMTGAYSVAIKEFANALAATPGLPAPLRADAIIRRADCLYYTGDHASARSAYAEAIAQGAPDSDYAAYRHAVMTGLAKDINGKIAELNAMEQKFPTSRWLPDAMLEKAITYQGLGRNGEADKAFRQITVKYPEASQARQAMLHMAIDRMKAGNTSESAAAYREIIERWPSSEEASIATDDLKKYYASTGELAEFAQFLASVPGAPALNADEMEQLAFDGAETAYAENIRNTVLLRRYIENYPDGRNLAQALYDIALSEQDACNYEEAEQTLTRLLVSRPHSTQAPEALLLKAEILERQLSGRTKDALLAYRELEKTGNADFTADAVSGVMRTATDPRERLEYARRARNTGGLSADRLEEASLYEARALEALGRKEEAATLYESLAANPAGENGAKAAVALAQYHLDAGHWEEARKTAERFTDEGTPHQYWLAKGYITLADAWHGLGNDRLATEYLRSLRDNYPGNEKDIANDIASRLKAWTK